MRLSRALAIGGVLTVATGVLAACAADEPADPGASSITIAIPSNQFVTSFDPAGTSFGLWFMPNQPVYDPLIKWDPEENAYGPWLASEFEISDDGLTLSMTLREDVTFSDGEQLTAEGVVDAFNYAVGFESSYFNASTRSYDPIATATGEYTLEIRTTLPTYSDGDLMLVLNMFPVVSPAAFDNAELLATEPVGSGPYILEEIIPEVSATYVRNPDYWNPDAFDFDEISFAVFDDRVAGLNALKSGQVDVAELDFALAAEAESSDLAVHTGPSGYTGIIVTDRQGATLPPLGDVRVRQAMNMAFDRQAIVDELELGYGRVSSQPFGDYSREYVEGGDDRYPYDPERAKELLAEAGYPDGFTLPLPDKTASPWGSIDYLPIVEQYLGEIGITVAWTDYGDPVTEPAEWTANLEGVGFPAYVTFQNYAFAVSSFGYGDGWATQPVDDPEFLELQAAYASGTPEEHDAAQPKLAEYILEQAWYIPFSNPQVIWASRTDILVSSINFPTTLPNFGIFSKVE